MARLLPFNLPVELCEIIFKYLSTNDLIQLSLVSKTFANFIGNNCMRNILLTIKSDDVIKYILRSKRSYKRIKLKKLKNVHEVINFLSASLIELEVEECEGGDCKIINLNNLKELSLSCCETTIFNCFKDKIPNLKIINLYQLHGNEARVISEFLTKNSSIEELNFYLDDSSLDVFHDDSSSLSRVLNLSLKSIFISNKSNNELQASTLLNIEKFLIAQGHHLQIMSLINSANLVLLLRIWNDLKALKQLYFFTSDPFFDYSMDTVSLQLTVNPHLKEFELHSLTPFPLQLTDIKIFLEAAPNLELLSLWHLRRDIVEFAEVFLKKLKLVTYVTIDDDCRIYLKSKNGINADQLVRFRQCLI